jgi:hypothetical protein
MLLMLYAFNAGGLFLRHFHGIEFFGSRFDRRWLRKSQVVI